MNRTGTHSQNERRQNWTRSTQWQQERAPVKVAAEHEEPKPTQPGYRREVRRSLNKVYERVGLPPILWDKLSAGQRKATTRTAEYIEPLKVNRQYTGKYVLTERKKLDGIRGQA